MELGLDKLKKWINKDTVDEKVPTDELSAERKNFILNASKEEARRAIVKTIEKDIGKYVVTDKPFSVAEKIGNKVIEDFDYERNEAYQFVKTAQKDETLVTTFTPIKEHPGLYNVTAQPYKNGKKDWGHTSEIKVITWNQLKELVDKSQKLYQERKESGLFYPDNILATNDGMSLAAIKTEWTKKGKNLLENLPSQKSSLASQLVTDAEKAEAFLEKRKADRKKDEILGLNKNKVISTKPFSFVTKIDDTIDRGLEPYAKILATDKSWKKSPIDKEVTVYTFTPVSKEEQEYGERGYKVSKETFKNGKSTSKYTERDTVDVTWKNFEDMAKMEKRIHEAHIKAGGKFYPPGTVLIKDEKELKVLKSRMTQPVKKVQGLRHRKQEPQRGR